MTAARGPVEPAQPSDEVVQLASRVPASIRFGTSSWSFPGWAGIVFAEKASEQKLSREGLAAYARHPLFRAVGLDRTHYAPMSTEQFAAHAAQVPPDFRFLVKAHEACTIFQWPDHPRYGRRKGTSNELFLAVDHAARNVVEPAVAGLGSKLGTIVFQCAPQSMKPLGGPEAFLDRLHRFLAALPKLPAGSRYAVEVRNRELLTDAYAAALADAGAVNCLTSMGRMPSLAEQWARAKAGKGGLLVVRWMVRRDETYESAVEKYEPFDRIVDEDPLTRLEIAQLAIQAAADEQEVIVVANNKAEGSAPLSLIALARTICEEMDAGA